MENIMLKDSRKKQIKIIDFGLSNWSTGENHLETHCGSPEYAAPELFLVGQKYGPEVDLWSLGIILYGMVTGQLPFLSPRNDKTSPEQWRRKLMAQIFRGLTSLQEKKISTISKDYKNLVRRLLEPIAHRRIPMVEVCKHPWLKDKNENVSIAPDISSSYENLESDVLRTIFQELNTITRQNELTITEKIRLKPYGEIGGMFNIKAHKLLGTGSADVFEPSSSSIGQRIRTVGRLLSRDSSSRNSSTIPAVPSNNSYLQRSRIASDNAPARMSITETGQKEDPSKKTKGSFSSACNSFTSTNRTTRTYFDSASSLPRGRERRTGGQLRQDLSPRRTVIKSTSTNASIPVRPMTQPRAFESRAHQLPPSLMKPNNYSRFRPFHPGPSILPQDESHARLRGSMEIREKNQRQQRYSAPDVDSCTKSMGRTGSATRVNKIGRIMMPLVSTSWRNSGFTKNSKINEQSADIFSKSQNGSQHCHQNTEASSPILARGKTFSRSINSVRNTTKFPTRH